MSKIKTTLSRGAQSTIKSHLKSALGLPPSAASKLVNGFALSVAAAAAMSVIGSTSKPATRKSRGPGRPKGSTSKPAARKSRGPGRPKGSKNKSTAKVKARKIKASASDRARPGSPEAVNRAKARKAIGASNRGRLDAASKARFLAALAAIEAGKGIAEAKAAAKDVAPVEPKEQKAKAKRGRKPKVTKAEGESEPKNSGLPVSESGAISL